MFIKKCMLSYSMNIVSKLYVSIKILSGLFILTSVDMAQARVVRNSKAKLKKNNKITNGNADVVLVKEKTHAKDVAINDVDNSEISSGSAKSEKVANVDLMANNAASSKKNMVKKVLFTVVLVVTLVCLWAFRGKSEKINVDTVSENSDNDVAEQGVNDADKIDYSYIAGLSDIDSQQVMGMVNEKKAKAKADKDNQDMWNYEHSIEDILTKMGVKK